MKLGIVERVENMLAAAEAPLPEEHRICSRSYWECSFEQGRKKTMVGVCHTKKIGCKSVGTEMFDAEKLSGKAFAVKLPHAAGLCWGEDDLYSEMIEERVSEVEFVIAAQSSRRRR